MATQLVRGAGVAYALKMDGTDKVLMTNYGEGAGAEGDAHEAFNFAAIYKLLPNIKLMWCDVIVASCGTAILFEAGQTLIGYFLANFITANIYGAAGGIIVLLIWVYYSAQIFLFGAEFTWVYAKHRRASRQARTAASAEYQSPG